MYKFIIISSFFVLTSCDLITYTVESNYATDVEVSGEGAHNNLIIRPGECVEFLDVFGVYGDFPLRFSSGKNPLGNNKAYKEGNYMIQANGTVKEVSDEKACVATANFKQSEQPTGDSSSKPGQLTPSRHTKGAFTPSSLKPNEKLPGTESKPDSTSPPTTSPARGHPDHPESSSTSPEERTDYPVDFY